MHCKMLSAICFDLDQSKVLLSGNELRLSSVNASSLVLLVLLMGGKVITHYLLKQFPSESSEQSYNNKDHKHEIIF